MTGGDAIPFVVCQDCTPHLPGATEDLQSGGATSEHGTDGADLSVPGDFDGVMAVPVSAVEMLWIVAVLGVIAAAAVVGWFAGGPVVMVTVGTGTAYAAFWLDAKAGPQ
ncbi:hypothetical protein [Kineosporia sp. A_224]|uniref:hypothetical protein n=1 Tax=Kineosporia sp. A_224 TaxID=1962180 RepID=UPI00130429BC|nr:hypothetical protein [Kineosporia sp. A_224]